MPKADASPNLGLRCLDPMIEQIGVIR